MTTTEINLDKATKRKLYGVWYMMKFRCERHDGQDAKNYSGRGITYDPRWKDFNAFCEDMALTYQEGLTLERSDNNKGYSPENCHWATRLEQGNNKRNNKYYTFKGKTLTMSQWCRELGLKRSTVQQRYYVYHWTIERSLGL